MHFYLIIFTLIFPLSVLKAQTIDEKLQAYVVLFKLAPLEKETIRNVPLWLLGRRLFFERELSGNRNISCADCHHPAVMTHDALPLAIGEGAIGIGVKNRRQESGKLLARNSPALMNLTNDIPSMFWDGRIEKLANGVITTPVSLAPEVTLTVKSTIAAQALFPLVDHAEMRGQKGSNPIADAESEIEAWELLTQRIMSIPNYKEELEKIFPGEVINIGHIGEAIAEFERETFYFAHTPYDQYLRGDLSALTETQKRGMDVFFGKGRCGECHNGKHLSNFEFYNVGVPQIGPGKEKGDDFGRFGVTKNTDNMYAFRVPPLRNISQTAPYMHNGAFKTLAEVVEHYDNPEVALMKYIFVNVWRNYSEEIKDHDHSQDEARILKLSNKIKRDLEFLEEEEEDLVEFLETALTDRRFKNRSKL